MKRVVQALRHAGLALLSGLLMSSAQAHLMVAQKGTLNLSGDGGFLVLSLPVSALQGVDDDRDGLLSVAEMHRHTERLHAQLQSGVQLLGANGPVPLQGLMWSLSPPDSPSPGSPRADAADQLVVMGRFALGVDAAEVGAPGARMQLQLGLFGRLPHEQQIDLTVTRALPLAPTADSGRTAPRLDTQWLRFAPGGAAQPLFAPPAALFAEHLRLGAGHVLSGWDHLLFLLVVLWAGLGWRPVLAALSCFTAGHAITLVLGTLGLVSLPAAVVEPAIAATIVGLLGFDGWSRRRGRPQAPGLRLALVFVCALVHGLGLAEALGHLGLGSAHLAWSLAGFNAGIELAQLAVALGCAALIAAAKALRRAAPAAQVGLG